MDKESHILTMQFTATQFLHMANRAQQSIRILMLQLRTRQLVLWLLMELLFQTIMLVQLFLGTLYLLHMGVIWFPMIHQVGPVHQLPVSKAKMLTWNSNLQSVCKTIIMPNLFLCRHFSCHWSKVAFSIAFN